VSVLWILGEAKSGKSELAEEIFHRLPGRKLYIGTLPKTPENAEQMRKHAERRPQDWVSLSTACGTGLGVMGELADTPTARATAAVFACGR